MRQSQKRLETRTSNAGAARFSQTKRVALLALLAALATWAASQSALIVAQREYQASRLAAFYQHRAEQGLPGGALPAGEYAWTMEFRCVTHEACIEAFGFPILAPWQESYTFAAHLTSDSTRMRYRGASVYRGRAGAGAAGACEDPNLVPFSGTCVFGESAEAFIVRDPAYPPSELAGRPLLWVRNALLYSPLLDGSNRAVPCPCGPDGEPTPTPAALETLSTDYFAHGRPVPAGVELTVQLVKLP